MSKLAYEQSDAGRETRKRNYDKFPEKRKARRAISNAIRDGRFPKASDTICEICNDQAKEYHHYRGYDKVFHFCVASLCPECHIIVDRPAHQ